MQNFQESIDVPLPSIRSKAEKMAELLLGITDKEEMIHLLLAMLAPAELEGISLRWKLLQQLSQGIPQREIMANLKIGLGKISRGSRMLKYGDPRVREILKKFSNPQK